MKINSRIERLTIRWDQQSGYPNELDAGSPEHSGAHSRLLELAIEMKSDFEPYGKRTREGEHWEDSAADAGTVPFSMAAGSGLGRLHEQELSKSRTADIRTPGVPAV